MEFLGSLLLILRSLLRLLRSGAKFENPAFEILPDLDLARDFLRKKIKY